jgi:hypothetical protein
MQLSSNYEHKLLTIRQSHNHTNTILHWRFYFNKVNNHRVTNKIYEQTYIKHWKQWHWYYRKHWKQQNCYYRKHWKQQHNYYGKHWKKQYYYYRKHLKQQHYLHIIVMSVVLILFHVKDKSQPHREFSLDLEIPSSFL